MGVETHCAMPLSPIHFNLGTEENPDIINVKHVARFRKVPKTNQWQLFFLGGTTETELPLMIDDDKYKMIQSVMEEARQIKERGSSVSPRMMILEESPRVRIG